MSERGAFPPNGGAQPRTTSGLGHHADEAAADQGDQLAGSAPTGEAEPKGPSSPSQGDRGQPGGPVLASADVEALLRERDEYLDALRRVQAEYENYKKRMIRQQTDHLERAAEALVVKLLPVLDALDLAAAHASSDSEDSKALGQVAAMLHDILKKEGLEQIDPTGAPFDPNVHDAVMHEEGEDGPRVSEVLRPGYCWKGRVLRPAMVKVKG